MSDKHDELALGMAKQHWLHDGDSVTNISGYYIVALEDCTFTTVTPITEKVSGNTDMFDAAGDAVIVKAGNQFPVTIKSAALATGACIIYSRD